MYNLSILASSFLFFLIHVQTSFSQKDGKFEVKVILGDEVIIDKTSSLMWANLPKVLEDNGRYIDERLTYKYSGVNAYKNYTYNDAEKLIELLNSEKFGSYDDWRIPTENEAKSLVLQNPYPLETHPLEIKKGRLRHTYYTYLDTCLIQPMPGPLNKIWTTKKGEIERPFVSMMTGEMVTHGRKYINFSGSGKIKHQDEIVSETAHAGRLQPVRSNN